MNNNTSELITKLSRIYYKDREPIDGIQHGLEFNRVLPIVSEITDLLKIKKLTVREAQAILKMCHDYVVDSMLN